MPQGLDRDRAAAAPRAADHAAVRDRATASRGRRLGRGARPGRRRLRALRPSTARTRSAVFGGGGLTNEKAYQLGKFARVALGTSQIDYNGRWCMSSAASAGNRAFGIDRGLPFPLADLERTDVLVLVGSNLAETMPPAARHLDALRERGGKVVVIDPRRTATARACRHVPPAGARHRPRPGARGAAPARRRRARSTRSTSLRGRTGFERVRRAVAAWWPERVERVTGVPAEEMRALAGAARHGASAAMVLTARGAEQHAHGHRHGARLDQRRAGARAAG